MGLRQKTGNEDFYFGDVPTGYQLMDFWRWQSSDLLNNALRGVLAEFIVAKALGITTDYPRVAWDAIDLVFNGSILEVKTSAYIQSWEQKTESALRFSIRPTREWCAENGYSGNPSHQADMYIFCVLAEKDREAVLWLLSDRTK